MQGTFLSRMRWFAAAALLLAVGAGAWHLRAAHAEPVQAERMRQAMDDIHRGKVSADNLARIAVLSDQMVKIHRGKVDDAMLARMQQQQGDASDTGFVHTALTKTDSGEVSRYLNTPAPVSPP